MSRAVSAPTPAESPALTLTIFGLQPVESVRDADSARHHAHALVAVDSVWQWPHPESADHEGVDPEVHPEAHRPLLEALQRRRRRAPAAPAGDCVDDLAALARQRLHQSTVEPAALVALRADLADDPALSDLLAGHPEWVAVSRLAPVHLQAGTDHALVFGPRYLDLAAADWASLVGDLNDWLIEDGLAAFTTRSGRQYLAYTAAGLSRVGQHDLPPLACALNRNVQPFLAGDDVRPLRRWLTELQMWLYAHPLNAARAKRGRPELNSLWVWGRAPLADLRAQPKTAEGSDPGDGVLVYTDSAELAGALWAGQGADAAVLMTGALPDLSDLTKRGFRPGARSLHVVYTEPAWCYLEGDVAGWANALDAADAFLLSWSTATGQQGSFALDDGLGQSWPSAGKGWRSWLTRLRRMHLFPG